MDPNETSEDTGPSVSVTQARQGVVSFRVLTVLAISTVLGLAALFIAWFVFAPGYNHLHGQTQTAPGPSAAPASPRG